jgi:hypothetical protein
LRARETFETHRRVIDWKNKQSPSGIPAGALGLPLVMRKIMRWQMQMWSRTDRANRFLGTWAASRQMDVAPGRASAAFFALSQPHWTMASPEQILRAGLAIQRFWLTATNLRLAMQPALATVIFADHGARGTEFTDQRDLRLKAASLASRFENILSMVPADCVFLGRIGEPVGPPSASRSVRRPLDDLIRQA